MNYDKELTEKLKLIIELETPKARCGGWDILFLKKYKDLYELVINSTDIYFKKYGFDYDFATRLKFIVDDKIEPILCEGCHKPIFLNNKLSHKWQTYHNMACRKLNKKSFTLNSEKYKAKTGYVHPMHNPEIKMKNEIRNNEKFGSKYFFSSEIGKKTLKESYKRNLGVDNPSHSKNIAKKISVSERKTHYKRLLKDPYVEPLFSFERYTEIKRDVDYLWWECKRCGKVFAALISHGIKNMAKSYAICPYCFPKRKYSSTEEFAIANWLSSLTLEKVYHRDTINRSTINGELDIYIPSLKFAIEYNGIYWHSEKFRKENGSSNRYSIFEKTKQCEDKGIVLFHIYEDEWIDINRRRKIEYLIKKLLFERNTIFDKILDRERIELPRDKFSLLLQPNGFKIESFKEPWLEKHLNFEILNAGSIVYRKV